MLRQRKQDCVQYRTWFYFQVSESTKMKDSMTDGFANSDKLLAGMIKKAAVNW